MGLRDRRHHARCHKLVSNAHVGSGTHCTHRHIAHIHAVRCREAEEDCSDNVLRMQRGGRLLVLAACGSGVRGCRRCSCGAFRKRAGGSLVSRSSGPKGLPAYRRGRYCADPQRHAAGSSLPAARR